MKMKLMWQVKRRSTVKDQADEVVLRTFDKTACERLIADDKALVLERCKVLS